MSILIKGMEKPKSCYAVDEESEYCPFLNTDDDCILLLKKGICEVTLKEQYSKCPLIETPEPCDDPRADVYYLAEKIGIHQLYALVVALRGEPAPCGDAVNREDAIRWVKTECNPYGKPTLDFESGKKVIEHLKRMAPVTPKRKTGKWKPVSDGYLDIYECDQCGETEDYERNYCPNCGADMRGK